MAQTFPKEQTATIAASGTTSDAVNIKDRTVVAIVPDSTHDGTNLTLQGSNDNSTFRDIYDDFGNAISITIATGKQQILDPVDSLSYQWLKVVSDATETSERSITVITRGVTD